MKANGRINNRIKERTRKWKYCRAPMSEEGFHFFYLAEPIIAHIDKDFFWLKCVWTQLPESDGGSDLSWMFRMELPVAEGFSFTGFPRPPCNRSICLTMFERLPHSCVQRVRAFPFFFDHSICPLSHIMTSHACALILKVNCLSDLPVPC